MPDYPEVCECAKMLSQYPRPKKQGIAGNSAKAERKVRQGAKPGADTLLEQLKNMKRRYCSLPKRGMSHYSAIREPGEIFV